MIRSVCVFCGARPGASPGYAALARQTGERLAQGGITLVYGGGALGLMGVVAGAALEAGGNVIGIIPDYLQRMEVLLPGLSETIIVDTLLERKRLMAERSDAFVSLPGGIGTLDEMVEMITWSALRESAKPNILIDHDGYWQPFAGLIDHFVSQGFADDSLRSHWTMAPDVSAMMKILTE